MRPPIRIGHHDVRQYAPQQDIHREPPIGRSRGSFGSKPTVSVGGPAAAIAITALRSAGEGPGSVLHTAVSTPAYGVPRSASANRSNSRCSGTPATMRSHRPGRRSPHTPAPSADSRAVRPWCRPGTRAAVALFERGQYLASSPGVAVGPIRQVEAVLSGQIEDVDVVGLDSRGIGGFPESQQRLKVPA